MFPHLVCFLTPTLNCLYGFSQRQFVGWDLLVENLLVKIWWLRFGGWELSVMIFWLRFVGLDLLVEICWLIFVGWHLLVEICWLRTVGWYLLVDICWFRFVGLDLFVEICKLRFVRCKMGGRGEEWAARPLAVPHLTSTCWEVGPLIPIWHHSSQSFSWYHASFKSISFNGPFWYVCWSALWPDSSILPNLTSSQQVFWTPIPNFYAPTPFLKSTVFPTHGFCHFFRNHHPSGYLSLQPIQS